MLIVSSGFGVIVQQMVVIDEAYHYHHVWTIESDRNRPDSVMYFEVVSDRENPMC